MAPTVTSWSSLDYETAGSPSQQQQTAVYPFRLRQNSVSLTPPSNNSLKSYGSISSFESDPYASLLSTGPAKPPRAFPAASSNRPALGPAGPFGRFHPQAQNYQTNRSKSHSDLVSYRVTRRPFWQHYLLARGGLLFSFPRRHAGQKAEKGSAANRPPIAGRLQKRATLERKKSPTQQRQTSCE